MAGQQRPLGHSCGSVRHAHISHQSVRVLYVVSGKQRVCYFIYSIFKVGVWRKLTFFLHSYTRWVLISLLFYHSFTLVLYLSLSNTLSVFNLSLTFSFSLQPRSFSPPYEHEGCGMALNLWRRKVRPLPLELSFYFKKAKRKSMYLLHPGSLYLSRLQGTSTRTRSPPFPPPRLHISLACNICQYSIERCRKMPSLFLNVAFLS